MAPGLRLVCAKRTRFGVRLCDTDHKHCFRYIIWVLLALRVLEVMLRGAAMTGMRAIILRVSTVLFGTAAYVLIGMAIAGGG